MPHILLVDDDAHVREALGKFLTSKKCSYDAAASLDEAFSLINGNSFYDAVILDLWLREQSGLDFLQHLSAIKSATPVIAISGGGPGRTLEQAVAMADALNASSVLMKPFRNEEILAALQASGLHLE